MVPVIESCYIEQNDSKFHVRELPCLADGWLNSFHHFGEMENILALGINCNELAVKAAVSNALQKYSRKITKYTLGSEIASKRVNFKQKTQHQILASKGSNKLCWKVQAPKIAAVFGDRPHFQS
jgi:histidinol-phosphate/aromatic aminotransferase/cobyric acid decarboxylase-like protein